MNCRGELVREQLIRVFARYCRDVSVKRGYLLIEKKKQKNKN